MKSETSFLDRVALAWPPSSWEDLTVLLAVSGGPDSVGLLRAMHSLKTKGRGRLVVAHFNHRLRGPDSDADEAFVTQLAAQMGLSVELGRPPGQGVIPRRGEGLEAAARRARYQFLGQAAARLGARYVAVAHTADDQAETILLRITRGTGLRGLGGMTRTRFLPPAATLIRPLLGLRRAEVRSYLEDLGQPYREDSSNQDLRRTRNRIRHRLLPELAAHYSPHITDALIRLGNLAREAQDFIDLLVDQALAQAICEQSPNAVRIDLRGLRGQPRYLLRELLAAVWRRQGWPQRQMGFVQWDCLATMILQTWEPSPGNLRRHTFPGNIVAEIDSGELRLRPGA